jgi:hypothetical protein
MREDWVTQLAYTGAEAFVAVALTADFEWLRQRLDDVLGPLYPQHLTQSRDRLDRASSSTNGRAGDRHAARSAEVQVWCERLCDTLRDRPEVAIRLRSAVDEAGVRLLLAPPVLPSATRA